MGACDRCRGTAVFELLNHGMHPSCRSQYRFPLTGALVARATMGVTQNCLNEIMDEICVTKTILDFAFHMESINFLLAKEEEEGYYEDGHICLTYEDDRKRIRSYGSTRAIFDEYEGRKRR